MTQANDGILHLKLHPECKKLDDPRMNKVRKGQMSIEMFTLLLTPDDPFVIIGDTIYAMTAQEYYASKSLLSLETAVEASFKELIAEEDYSYMSDADQKYMQKVKTDLPNCPSCRYKRYKDEVYKISKKYGKAVSTSDIEKSTIKPYPKPATLLTGKQADPVLPIVSTMLEHLYKMPMPVRKACVECVRKHVASAFVLAGEAVAGYPEHIAVINAHYGEAIDEAPVEAAALRDTLGFCMAKTAETKTPFVPMGAIMAQLRLIETAGIDHESLRTEAAATLELDISEDIMKELDQLPDEIRRTLYKCAQRVEDFILEYKNTRSKDSMVSWEGAMNVLAEKTAQVTPLFTNMVRNRRLLFRGDPALMLESGYSMQDILQYMQ